MPRCSVGHDEHRDMALELSARCYRRTRPCEIGNSTTWGKHQWGRCVKRFGWIPQNVLYRRPTVGTNGASSESRRLSGGVIYPQSGRSSLLPNAVHRLLDQTEATLDTGDWSSRLPSQSPISTRSQTRRPFETEQRAVFLAVFLCCGLLLGCDSPSEQKAETVDETASSVINQEPPAEPAAGAVYSPRPQGTLTFNADIAPIVFRKCAPCHHAGEIGPLALVVLDYQNVLGHPPLSAIGHSNPSMCENLDPFEPRELDRAPGNVRNRP